MKKLVSIFMALTLLLSFAACSNNTNHEGSSPTSQQSSVPNFIAAEESNHQNDSSEPTEESNHQNGSSAPIEGSNHQNGSSAPTEESNHQNGSSAPTEGSNHQNNSSTPTEESSNQNNPSTPTETGSKSLVVYFSWSGNTEHVAKSIQTQTDSDIFEIVPTIPYSDDYDTVVDLAQEEQRNNARPAISSSIENIEQYDVIYVGFPNWWGDMPMILYTFFDTYDLSGKTVALFCTSGGSGLSGTVNEVKSLEPNATVTQGLHIGSGSSSNPDRAVSEWLHDIGLAK